MNAKREKPGEEKEVFITKKYATMGGFMRGVRNAFIKVFGDDDNLTLIEPGEDRTVEERIRAGEFVTHAEGSKELGYKLGWEIEFPDRIYVYYTPEWKDETEEQEEKMKEKEPWGITQEEWAQSKEKEIKQIIKNFGYWEDIPESELEARLQSRRRELLDTLLGTIRPEIKPKVEKELEEVDKALKLLRSSHKELVEQALKEGKPVPDEVLKDYPDLAEKYGRAVKEQDREMRVIERLKMLGVEIDEPPIITTIGKTKTVVGKIDEYRLNFVIGDIQKEDIEEFDTLKIGDKVLWVKKSPMLSMLKEKLRRGEKKPKVMKLVPEYGGLKRFEQQDMTLTEKLQLKYLKEHGNL